MAATEERVASLEARVDEHTRGLADLRQEVIRLEERMDRRFDTVDTRFIRIEERLDRMDDRLTRSFTWLVGIQVTTLAAILAEFGGLAAAFAAR